MHTGKIDQIRDVNRPMKMNKQLRMLMLKKEKKSHDKLLRIAVIVEKLLTTAISNGHPKI